jgi:ATP-binding cassette subfamily B (MDR/TAP) protein 7
MMWVGSPRARPLHRALLRSSLNASKCCPVHRPSALLLLRQFSHTNHLRRNDRPRQQEAQARVQLRTEQPENTTPESYEEPNNAKLNEAPKTDGLLSEQTVSNKEQRKADWAIMKEMSRYLWPKVW